MANSTKSAINNINEVSRQLLSLLEANIKSTNDESTKGSAEPNSSLTFEDSQFSDDKSANLVTKRHNLINQLFEKYTQEELSHDLELINEMVLIDQQLVEKSQTGKKVLAEQVIKLKNSKKVRKIYNKY